MRRTVIAGFGAAAMLSGLATAASADEMTFRLIKGPGDCANCNWIAAEGEITSETTDHFVKFLTEQGLFRTGRPMVIYLDSPGGNLTTGITMGGIIRREGLHTSIGRTEIDGQGNASIASGSCASACSFAFLGGVVRAAQGGQLGVHQFYNADALADPSNKAFSASDVSSQQLLGAILINFVVRMGVDPRFASLAASTKPDDLYYFSDEELEDLKINWDPNEFGPWKIEMDGSGVVAASETSDGTRKLALYCRSGEGGSGIARVRLSGLGDKSYAMVDAIRGRGGVGVFGWMVDQGDVEADGQGGVEFTLGGFFPDVTAGKETLFIGDDMGLALAGDYPELVLPGASASRAFAVAMRNCV